MTPETPDGQTREATVKLLRAFAADLSRYQDTYQDECALILKAADLLTAPAQPRAEDADTRLAAYEAERPNLAQRPDLDQAWRDIMAEPTAPRQAGFLRVYASQLRQRHPWDIAETMASAIEGVANGINTLQQHAEDADTLLSKTEQAFADRLEARLIERLDIDPNAGDVDSGDPVDFIVAMVKERIRREREDADTLRQQIEDLKRGHGNLTRALDAACLELADANQQIQTLTRKLADAQAIADYHSECRPNRQQALAAIADAKAMNDKWADEVAAHRETQAQLATAVQDHQNAEWELRDISDVLDAANVFAHDGSDDELSRVKVLIAQLAALTAENQEWTRWFNALPDAE